MVRTVSHSMKLGQAQFAVQVESGGLVHILTVFEDTTRNSSISTDEMVFVMLHIKLYVVGAGLLFFVGGDSSSPGTSKLVFTHELRAK